MKLPKKKKNTPVGFNLRKIVDKLSEKLAKK